MSTTRDRPVAGHQASSPGSRKERLRTGVAFALGALTVLFAVLNLDPVSVSWIIATWQTPLIVVILVSVLIGVAFGWIMARRRPPRVKA